MKIKIFKENEYINDIVEVGNDKFILLINLYHHKKYQIVVTDFKEYRKSIELEDREKIMTIHPKFFFQKLDQDRIFINSMSDETIHFLKSENIKVVSPPDFLFPYLEYRVENRKLQIEDNEMRKYLIDVLWTYGEYYVTLQSKMYWKQLTGSSFVRADQLKMVVYSCTGEVVKEIPMRYVSDNEDVEMSHFQSYTAKGNIFVGKINDQLFVIDIDKGHISKYLLKNNEYSIQDINTLGQIILSYKRNLIILQSTDHGIETTLTTEYKGFIKSARFNHSNDLVIFFSRNICSYKQQGTLLIKEIGTPKIYINRTLIMNDGRLLVYYYIYNKLQKTSDTEIKIMEI